MWRCSCRSRHGATVDEVLTGHAVCEELQAHTDWPRLLELVAHDAQVIVSNTTGAISLMHLTAPRCWVPPRKSRAASRPNCWCCVLTDNLARHARATGAGR
jgi:hypothetical protein